MNYHRDGSSACCSIIILYPNKFFFFLKTCIQISCTQILECLLYKVIYKDISSGKKNQCLFQKDLHTLWFLQNYFICNLIYLLVYILIDAVMNHDKREFEIRRIYQLFLSKYTVHGPTMPCRLYIQIYIFMWNMCTQKMWKMVA